MRNAQFVLDLNAAVKDIKFHSLSSIGDIINQRRSINERESRYEKSKDW